MKKKILLVAMLSSVSVSVYPAWVRTRNLTKKPVWARINDQTRERISEGVSRMDAGFALGSATVSLGLTKLLSEAGKAVERFRYPNFVKISPDKSRRFSTAVMSELKHLGLGVGVVPIEKVTFLRVKGYKKFTGSLKELSEILKPLAAKYGNLKLEEFPDGTVAYDDYFSNKRDQWSKRERSRSTFTVTLNIPEFEEFTYKLGKQKIKGTHGGVIELKSWGNAIRTK